MNKQLILGMCKEIVEGKQNKATGFECQGINCEECPISIFNNSTPCNVNTDEDIITTAKKYIAENTEFDWEEFKNGSIVVHCDTLEKAKDFLKECDNHNIKWNGDTKASDFLGICSEGINENCYCCYYSNSKLIYSSLKMHKSKERTIIKWNIKEENEVENKFKVGDKVKKINGDLFGQFRDRPHKVVTIEKIDDYSIWFKETGTSLAFCDVDEIEKVTENKTKITFKEFVNEAEEGKIYVSESGAEFYKDCGKIIIDLTTEVQRIKIPDDAILTLKKQEYTFAEAIEKAREGNVIMSLASRECYTPSEIEKSIFELSEIEGKWNVEE